jgi:anti-sigma regulatory factor (Ser/Thr protein kinase)
MTKPPLPQATRLQTAAKAEQAADLPLRVGAQAARLDLALLRWEVSETVRQRCAALSPERRGDLVLVVNELATNAIRYGGGGLVNVTVTAGADAVSVRVYDGVATPPQLHDPDDATEDGRGLRLVDELTGHRWGHRITPGGKFVWALVTYAPPHSAAGLSAA